MPKQILFIHGAGEGAYKEDKVLVDRLQQALGADYKIHYPKMPDEANAPYDLWKRQIRQELHSARRPNLMIGHSIGASHLIKFLTQAEERTSLAGVFLLETPFWGGRGWRYEGYKELEIPKKDAIKIPDSLKVFLYHTQNDEIVPVRHLDLYGELIPSAATRKIASGGHQLNGDVSWVVKDIKSLHS